MKAPPIPFLPPLTADELAMLRAFPYERQGTVSGTREVKIAAGLVERELLEKDPTASRMVVRCTARGEEARRPLTRHGAERVVDEIAERAGYDDEAAASLERTLWMRVLAETALDESGDVRTLARIALRTRAYDFRR